MLKVLSVTIFNEYRVDIEIYWFGIVINDLRSYQHIFAQIF